MRIQNQKNIIYLFVVFIFFALFLFKAEFFSSFKFGVINVVSIPIKILSTPFKEIKKILYYHRTFDEYVRLRSEVNQLTARLIAFDEVILENSRLAKLLEFKREMIYSTVPAGVIGRDPYNWNSSMVIDKGERDAIKVGYPVVNDLGVVGKIAEVGSTSSKVILLTDPQFSVAAMVQRPRESGLLVGTLNGQLRLRYLDPHADIQVGDKVITSKLSSSFPERLLIGDVVFIEDDPQNSTVNCLVEPAVSFSQFEEVLVIINDEKHK